MIARFKIELSFQDILEIFKINKSAIGIFEKEFRKKFGFKYAFSYAYGRSALKFLIESTGIRNSEIILSGYTCSVVAHAVVLSRNIPVFVDINLKNFNPSVKSICNAITPRTRFVILSHTFGFPQNSKAMENEIKKYEKKYKHKIWLINDCAHSFDAKNSNNRVMDYGDATIFGLNISKSITSIFGGITATNNLYLAQKIIRFNKKLIQTGSIKREIYQRLYIVLAFIGFKPIPYRITQVLIRKTKLLSKLTDSYHLDGVIHFPKDHDRTLTRISAQIGCLQLRKYDQIVNNRINNSKIYESELIDSSLIQKPKIIDGSTFSHYPILVSGKSAIRDNMLRKGVECGEIIQYSIPELESYGKYVSKRFPAAAIASKSVINLPINYSSKQTQRICILFNQVISDLEFSKNAS
jgi:perosamine synthetase